MRTRVVSLTVLAFAVGGLTACSPQPAQPEPAPSAIAPSSPVLPARPREVRVDGIDPCSLVDSGLLAEIGVGTEQRRGKPEMVNTSTSLCEWSNPTARPLLTLAVWAVPDKSVTDYMTEESAAVTSVAGFPALDAESAGFDPDEACLVRVDVAAGQGVWVDLTSEYGRLPGASHELMCRKAHVAAEGVMRALLARTG